MPLLRHEVESGQRDCYSGSPLQELPMPKGEQRSNKMAKKPRKDTSPPKESSSTSDRPVPPTTTIMPKGKLKKV